MLSNLGIFKLIRNWSQLIESTFSLCNLRSCLEAWRFSQFLHRMQAPGCVFQTSPLVALILQGGEDFPWIQELIGGTSTNSRQSDVRNHFVQTVLSNSPLNILNCEAFYTSSTCKILKYFWNCSLSRCFSLARLRPIEVKKITWFICLSLCKKKLGFRNFPREHRHQSQSQCLPHPAVARCRRSTARGSSRSFRISQEPWWPSDPRKVLDINRCPWCPWWFKKVLQCYSKYAQITEAFLETEHILIYSLDNLGSCAEDKWYNPWPSNPAFCSGKISRPPAAQWPLMRTRPCCVTANLTMPLHDWLLLNPFCTHKITVKKETNQGRL